MSIKLELDADSIKKAIMSHISNQGFDLADKQVDVALVNGRGGNGNRATITISDGENSSITVNEVVTKHKDVASKPAEEEVKIIDPNEEALEVASITENDQPEVDMAAIMPAAETDPDAPEEPSDLFQKVDPSDVKPAESLF